MAITRATNLAGLGTVFDGTELRIGSSVDTGTANQLLQVTGGAYISDHVGIGDTNPVSKLVVNGGFNNYIPSDSGSGLFDIYGGQTSLYNAYIGIDDQGVYFGHTGTPRKLFLQTNETTRMTISSDGLVGVGTTVVSTLHMFDVMSTRGAAGSSAIRATYPGGGNLTGTEFSAISYRDDSWRAIYAKAGSHSANSAVYADGNSHFVNGSVGIETTSPAEKLSVAGNIRIQNPANALQYLTIAYNGINFTSTGAGSSTAVTSSTLDDYEEGTWTPKGNNVTFTTALGRYTKIGRLVFAGFYIVWPSNVDTNQSDIYGQPFVSDGPNQYGGGFISFENTALTQLQLYAGAQTSFRPLNAGGNLQNQQLSTRSLIGTYIYEAGG